MWGFLPNFLIFWYNRFVRFLCSKTFIVDCNGDYAVVFKQYDLKINSNNPDEYTLESYLKSKFPLKIQESCVHSFYFVHRLDYATSGLIIIAFNRPTSQLFSKSLAKGGVIKIYVALVRGIVSQDILDVNCPIGEDKRYPENQKMCTGDSEYCKHPKKARTVMMVLSYGVFNGYPCTKLLIRTFNGRRHQIRVHCSSLGHTIVGDYTYSNKKDVGPYRMFLSAACLEFKFHNKTMFHEAPDGFDLDWTVTKEVTPFGRETYEKLKNWI